MLKKFLDFVKNNLVVFPAFATLVSAGMIYYSATIAYKSLDLSTESTKRNSAIATLAITQQIRSRYLDVQRILNNYDIFNYPKNGRHYSENERLEIRRYWEEVAFHEYVMCNEFQQGVMKDQWIIYRDFIKNALQNEILEQEYAYFKANQTTYKSLIAEKFFNEIDSLSDVKNWTDVENSRKADIEQSKSK
jgi:flagellar biosynthesis/type III secretory pathway chaperone